MSREHRKLAPRGPRPRRGLATMGRALRHRNYRLFFAGNGVSLVGSWITRVATGWLVYRLTGSAVLLGVIGFAGQIPMFVVAPFAGVLIDRWDRRRVLILTQVASMVQSTLLAAFTLTGAITIEWIAALSLLQGLINAFDMPARQSFVADLVRGRDDLPNAIALNSSLVNASRMVGPSIAGVLIVTVGEGWCFAVDAVTYLGAIGALLAMRDLPWRVPAPRDGVTGELADGYRTVARSRPIRTILAMLALVSLLGSPHLVLMPVFAREVLGGGPQTLGLLMGALGVGALAGALWLASRPGVVGLDRVVVAAGAIFGAALAAFALSSSLLLSIVALAAAGAGSMVQTAASNTLVQTLAGAGQRGRVMSFYTMAFFGVTPFGSLLAGGLAAAIGPSTTVLVGAAVAVLAVTIVARQRSTRAALQRDRLSRAARRGFALDSPRKI